MIAISYAFIFAFYLFSHNMFISGFTIIKNAVKNDYPIVEAISSILPVVDEMIVLVGDCEDDTLQLIESIKSDKIKIHHSVWDNSLRKGGVVLAVETNKAFKLINPKADWAFYIQADEAVHEKYLPVIKKAMNEYAADKRVDGLLFHYTHFYGTYDYVGDSRKWYSKEIRIIRNDPAISSYRDAQGFRKNGEKLKVKLIDAYIYHYGWVKSPKQMMKKIAEVRKFWHPDEELAAIKDISDDFDYTSIDSITSFEGTHPEVYVDRVNNTHWNVALDISKKKFKLKDQILYKFEKLTGVRLFDYQNYKII